MVQQARSAGDLVASTLDALTSSHRSSSHHAAAGSGRRRGTVAAPRAWSPPPPQQQQPMDQSKFNPGRVRVSRPEADVDAAPAAWAKQYGAAYGMEELKLSISHLTDVPPSAAAGAASCGAAGEEDSAGEEETRPCEAAV